MKQADLASWLESGLLDFSELAKLDEERLQRIRANESESEPSGWRVRSLFELIDFPDSNPYPPIEVALPDPARHAATFAEKMMRQLTIIGACLLLVSCDSSISDWDSYASPDGRRIIAVVEELQGANDPAPWWTHISLRDDGDDLREIPGNLLKLEGRGSVTATWNGNSEVTIFIDDALIS